MKKSYFIILCTITALLGCEKSDRDEDKSTYTSADVAFATNLVYDVFKTVHQAAYYSQGIVSSATIDTNTVFGCDTITVDTLSNPKSLQIKFNTDCTSNGIIRNGKLNAYINGLYDTPSTTTTISIYDYNYNGKTIFSGTMSYQYIGLTDSFPTYNLTFSELKIVNSYNQKIFYSGSHQLKIIQGKLTQEISDDVYAITGNNSGIVFKGNAFTSEITTNLNLAGNCNWIGSGLVDVKPYNNPTRTLDFGSGCDSKINVSIYDKTYDIEIP
ncbi:MAG: hypothetical protein AB7O47_03865 [Flavobacteriales bacterium]